MRSIIGVCWHSPFTLREWIGNWKQGLPENMQEALITQFLEYGDQELKEDVMVVFVPSFTVLKRNQEALDAADCVVVLFDNAIVLRQANITILDAVTNDSVRFLRRPLSEGEFIVKLREGLNGLHVVDVKEFQLVPNLISNANGSMTEILLNLTSRSRVADKRREITSAYVNWLLSGQALKVLVAALKKLDVDDDAIRYAVTWLESPVGLKAKEICAKISELRKEKKPVNYEKLCDKSGVVPFDLRSLLKYAKGAAIVEVNLTSTEVFKDRVAARANQAEDRSSEDFDAIDAEAKELEDADNDQ